MRRDERRRDIVNILLSGKEAVKGSELSKRLRASRQIIVQDIALLRAQGYEIISTHSGYIIKDNPLITRVFKVRHTSEQTRDELETIVALGGTVVDVYVWHKVYGKIEAQLNIFSRRGIETFLDGIKSGKSSELMNITDGYHYHTVRAESNEILDIIEKQLETKNYIVAEKEG
ncbi:MAG: transcription repressor NadR [Clostridia bacterium]|nr:transcription repressor NadR [Clostridia bacterium]MBQ7788474.1 transcription repressor NadR [Clostridia bacterium]